MGCRWLALCWLPVVAGGACGARTELESSGRPTSEDPEVTEPRLRLRCPTSPDDPRLPVLEPEGLTTLDGASFVEGEVRSWRWSVLEEDCDAVVPSPGYVVQGADTARLRFQPSRPAPYTIKLEVTGGQGEVLRCDMRLPVQGRGMRIELCWDTNTSTDLDLYLHTPFDALPWFTPSADSVVNGINGTTCNLANCTAALRFVEKRTDWGYEDSPLLACEAGAREFLALGRCPNPRAGVDNNHDPGVGTGTTERIQLDNPQDGQRFRVMVQNFDNGEATPQVFVYCAGMLAGTGKAPKSPARFRAPLNPMGFGLMWRPLEVVTRVDTEGITETCEVNELLAPNGNGPDVTIDDPRF